MKKMILILPIFLCLFFCSISQVHANTDIYVTSDAHIGPTSVTTCDTKPWYCINGGKNSPLKTNATRFSEFLQAINLTGATNRYLLVTGDVIQIYQGDDAYSHYKSLINSSSNKSSSAKVFTSIGNHELRPGSDELGILDNTQYQTKRTAFINNIGDIVKSETFGGIKVVRIGTDYANRPVNPWTEEYDNKDIPEDYSSLYGYASDATLTFLRNELEASKNAGQTVIVMTHWPMNSTVEASYSDSGNYGVPYRYADNSAKATFTADYRLNDIIHDSPNAIVVSGHSHWAFNGFWQFSDEETKDSISTKKSHSIYLHDGTGIKGTPNNGTTEFLKISFSDNKTATVYPHELNWAGTTISTINKTVTSTNPLHTTVKQFNWSWATVNYDANGGTGTAPAATYKYQTVKENNYTKTGFEFKEWNTKADGTGTGYDAGDSVTWTGANDFDLYANWESHKLFVRYHANGGTLKSEHGSDITLTNDVIYRDNSDLFDAKATYGGQISSDGLWNYNNEEYINLEKTGYIVEPGSEWIIGDQVYSQSIRYNVSDIADISATDQTVDAYVNWVPETYQITYNLDGGTTTGRTNYNIETNTFTLDEPTKTGYRFIGWTGSNGNIPQKTVTITQGTMGDKTYTANWEKLYTITFNSNGGSSVGTIEAGYGDSISEPTAPTKTGHVFAGWYSDSELTSIYVFDTMPNRDVILYAKWNKSIYQVMFNTNGGSSIATQEVEYQDNATEPADPTKNGYTFDGWYSDSELTTPYNFNSGVTSSIILYAKWRAVEYEITYSLDGGTASGNPTSYTIETPTFTLNEPTKEGYTFRGWTGSNGSTPQKNVSIEQGSTGNKVYLANFNINTYTVTFNTNGGTTITSQSVNHGNLVAEPTTPEKENYAFEGWYSDPELTTEYDFETPVTSNITLYAKWITGVYQITYDLDGGIADNPTYYDVETATFTLNNPTKTGYTFIGWTGSNGNTPEMTVTITQGSTGNKTYTANYTVNSYTIDFNYDGISSIEKNYGESITLPTPTKTGHRFIGWFKDNNLTEAFTETTMPAENITLYPKFEINTYTITFNTNGGSSISSIEKEYNEEIGTLPTPIKEGYSFQGWYSDSNLTEEFNLTNMPDRNITLYAKWEINTYTVTFNTNGGSSISSVEVTHNNTVSRPSDPTKTGYILEDWYSDSSLTTRYDFDSHVTRDLTLYAKWNHESYEITYDLNGGVANNPGSYNIETSTFTLNNPTKEGYTFTGWTGSNGNTPEMTVTITQGSTGAKTYTANYTVNSYTITFNSNGGTSVSPITKNYGETITAPEDPIKEGHNFVGWYSDSNLTNQYSFDTMPSRNITVYAKWSKKKYQVTFNSNGGNAIESQEVEYQGKATRPSNPTKTGYTFVGWYSDSELSNEYDFNSSITSAITLYGKWQATEYEITYNLNGGTATNRESYTVETPTFTLNNPEREGYTFTGWTGSNGDTPQKNVTIEQGSTGNKTYTAIYSLKTYHVSFETNGGNGITDAIVYHGTTVPMPTTPEKENYAFAGWYSDSNLTTEYDFETPVTRNITLYAKWIAGAYQITYDLDGGVADNPTYYTAETPTFTLNNPTKEGYTFTGWTGSNGNTPEMTVTITQGSSGAKTYTAHYQVKEYTINFNYDGIDSIEENYGEELVLPTPRKTGYSFLGWFRDSNLTEPFTATTMPAESLTLYPKFAINTYSISFYTNGGNSISNIEKEYNESIGTLPTPIKEGNIFAGWYSDSDLTEEFNLTNMPGRNITLYAKWNKNTYTVTFNTNGGSSIPSATVAHNNTLTRPTDPIKEGYTLEGWYTDSELTTKYNFSNRVTNDMTLYAKWEVAKYRITFNTNGGPTINSIEVRRGEAIPTIEDPVRVGYTFKGWYNDSELTSIFSDEVMPGRNITLYAKWEANRYTITFNSNGGSKVDSIEADYNTAITEPTAPLKEGYKFAGWYNDSNLTNLYSFTTMPAKDMTLYAKWVSNSKNVITYNLNGGKNNTKNPSSYTTGEEKQLYNPTKKGNKFVGWYLDGDFKTRVYKISKNMSGDLTLYAKWESIQDVKIPDTGTNIPTIAIVTGVSLLAIGGYYIYTRYRTVKK